MPLMNTRLPKLVVEVTLCEARTRSRSPLVVAFFPEEPHDGYIKMADRPRHNARTSFFKRHAPEDLEKKEVLVAKSLIIAKRNCRH